MSPYSFRHTYPATYRSAFSSTYVRRHWGFSPEEVVSVATGYILYPDQLLEILSELQTERMRDVPGVQMNPARSLKVDNKRSWRYEPHIFSFFSFSDEWLCGKHVFSLVVRHSAKLGEQLVVCWHGCLLQRVSADAVLSASAASGEGN